jgi:hypothetical protein
MTAEVLRHNKKPKLNITWDKDRGKDVESAPWFKVFKGDRINDHHLTLAEKRRYCVVGHDSQVASGNQPAPDIRKKSLAAICRQG